MMSWKATRFLPVVLSTLSLLALELSLSAQLFSATVPKAKAVRQEIQSRGKKRSYYLFVPENVTPESPAPLLVLLHGQGRNGLSLVEAWQDLAVKERIILAGPDASSSSWSIPEDGPDFIRDVVEELKSKYPVQPRRVYLFGHSAGAITAIYLALLESEYFAAAAVHAGAIRMPDDRVFLDYATRKIPMALFVGTHDLYFPLKAVRETKDLLASRGIPVQLTEIPRHDHNYYARSDQLNRKAWEFLRAIELASSPRYIQY